MKKKLNRKKIIRLAAVLSDLITSGITAKVLRADLANKSYRKWRASRIKIKTKQELAELFHDDLGWIKGTWEWMHAAYVYSEDNAYIYEMKPGKFMADIGTAHYVGKLWECELAVWEYCKIG